MCASLKNTLATSFSGKKRKYGMLTPKLTPILHSDGSNRGRAPSRQTTVRAQRLRSFDSFVLPSIFVAHLIGGDDFVIWAVR